MKRTDTPGRAGRLLLLAVFFAALWLPLGDTILGLDPTPQPREFRRMAPLPRLLPTWRSVAFFPPKFEAYYNDHFGWRGSLLRWHALAKVRLLGTSPTPRVVLGKEGWLFLGDERVLDDHRGEFPFPPGEIDRWVASLEERRAWLAAQGIHYLVVLVPNKHSIHPAFLPDGLKGKRGPSRADELLAGLRRTTALDVLDLRAPLRAAEGLGPLFQRTDTHWNGLGAYVAYRAIVERLAPRFPGMEPWPLADFRLERVSREGGDLARLMGLSDRFREEALELAPLRPRRAAEADTGLPDPAVLGPGRLHATERQAPALPRALVFHDSFTLTLMPLLSEHFRRIVYVFRKDFDPSFVARERPQLVIRELTERSLLLPPPRNNPELPR